jgi:prepilin-type N-terminal cleavage/methylation domain-containing protein
MAMDAADGIQGFTLIEMSIVLVIIALIVGGVLVGRDLIGAAQIRAQISQIEKYNQAVNAFHVKIDYLPGDLPGSVAASFGFPDAARGHPGVCANVVNGDGLLEGCDPSNPGQAYSPYAQGCYETGEFWVDLASDAGGHLIDGSFSNPYASCPAGILLQSGGINVGASLLMPFAKLGSNNFIYVYSDGAANWFGLAQILQRYTGLNGGHAGADNLPGFVTALTANQAYAIDSKIDDGFATSGNVEDLYVSARLNQGIRFIDDNQTYYNGPWCSEDYQTYAVTDFGNQTVCVLSFKFQ